MRSIAWGDAPDAAALPRVKAERFNGKGRYRIHLLEEPRPKKVHYRFGENTVPCEGEDQGCAFCKEPLWKKRTEAFAAALLMDTKQELWVPIVAIFTEGGYRQILKGEHGPYRGRVLEVWRVMQGTSNVLKVRELNRVDPLVPAFDITPHMLRVWFPHDQDLPPAPMPASVAFKPAEVHRPQIEVRPEPISQEVRDALRRHFRGAPALAAPAVEQRTTPPAAVVEPAIAAAAPAPAAEEKKPGQLALAELVSNPANYGPVTMAGVGTAEAPLIAPPARERALLSEAAREAAKSRRKKNQESGATDVAATIDTGLAECEKRLFGASKNGGAK